VWKILFVLLFLDSSLNGKSSPIASRLERTNKRSNTSSYETNTKRSRNEPKETMSSELLQQLMSNNHHRGRPKGKSNWLLDSGGQKAACISQPSDSVLMNLLVSGFDIRAGYICLAPTKSKR
jgi:hypothetical protein